MYHNCRKNLETQSLFNFMFFCIRYVKCVNCGLVLEINRTQETYTIVQGNEKTTTITQTTMMVWGTWGK